MAYTGNIRDPNDPQYNKYADEDIRRQTLAIDPTSADTQAGFQWNSSMSPSENASLRNEYQYGGHGAQLYIDEAGNRRIVPGTSGADQAVTHQEGLATSVDRRAAPATNYGQANADLANTYQDRADANAYGQLAFGTRGQQESALGQQSAAADLQRSAALGQQPSAAYGQLQYGLNRGLALNSSLAAGARGGGANLAAAQRAGMNANAQLAGQTNQQAAILRAGEMDAARTGYQTAAGAYQAGASGIRAQDVNQQQARIAQQGVDLNSRGQSQQQTQFGASLQQQQMGMNDQRSLAHESLANDIRKTQLGADIDRRNNAEQHWAAQGGFDSHATDRTSAGIQTGLAVGGAVVGGIAAGPAGAAVGGAAGGAAGKAATSSDIRVKHDIRPGDGAAEQAMDQRQAYTYEYNDPKLGKSPPAGIMAQDMERSPAGAATVIDTPHGKAIDGKQALSLMLAENTNLHHRLKAIEQRVAPAAEGVAGHVGDFAKWNAHGGAAPVVGKGMIDATRAVEDKRNDVYRRMAGSAQYAYGQGRALAGDAIRGVGNAVAGNSPEYAYGPAPVAPPPDDGKYRYGTGKAR